MCNTKKLLRGSPDMAKNSPDRLQTKQTIKHFYLTQGTHWV